MGARGEAGLPWPLPHDTSVQMKKKIPLVQQSFEIAKYEEYFEIILIKYLIISKSNGKETVVQKC